MAKSLGKIVRLSTKSNIRSISILKIFSFCLCWREHCELLWKKYLIIIISLSFLLLWTAICHWWQFSLRHVWPNLLRPLWLEEAGRKPMLAAGIAWSSLHRPDLIGPHLNCSCLFCLRPLVRFKSVNTSFIPPPPRSLPPHPHLLKQNKSWMNK